MVLNKPTDITNMINIKNVVYPFRTIRMATLPANGLENQPRFTNTKVKWPTTIDSVSAYRVHGSAPASSRTTSFIRFIRRRAECGFIP